MPPPTASTAPPRARERGSTLIELMVGLMVLAILTGMALPTTSVLWRRYNLRIAAEKLVSACDIARSRARSERRAYGLQIGTAGAGGELHIQVIRGTSTKCASLAGGVVVEEFDHSSDNIAGDPPIAITAAAPAAVDAATAFPCFKPDGRVLQADTAQPYPAPTGLSLQAGEVFVELARVDRNNNPLLPGLQVQLSYNGSARIVHGYNLAAWR